MIVLTVCAVVLALISDGINGFGVNVLGRIG